MTGQTITEGVFLDWIKNTYTHILVNFNAFCRKPPIDATAIRATVRSYVKMYIGTAICVTSTGGAGWRDGLSCHLPQTTAFMALNLTGFPSHFEAITAYFYAIKLL